MRSRLLSGAPRPVTPPSPLLVCFSHLRWNFVYQRPQHLISAAARSYRVYFFEEPLFERGAKPRLDLTPQSCGVVVAVPVLPERLPDRKIVAAQRALLDELLSGHAGEPTTFWYYTPMALAFSDHLEPNLCVYDCMDELSAFRGAPPTLVNLERRLFARADLVFAGGQSLYEMKSDHHHNIHAFPSSIDASHFVKARQAEMADPAEQAVLPRPRLGFFGVIDERMNLELVDRLADQRPDWQLVMIGPVAKIDPAILPRRPNIHWLGARRYEELPRYLAGWDIGLMPFALNDSTRFISPTKTPEFLAAGIPVVSTPISDVMRPYGDAGLVSIAADVHEVVREVERLMRRPRKPWLSRVDRHLSGTSWEKTWSAMHALMRRAEAAAAMSMPPSRVAHRPAAGAIGV